MSNHNQLILTILCTSHILCVQYFASIALLFLVNFLLSVHVSIHICQSVISLYASKYWQKCEFIEFRLLEYCHLSAKRVICSTLIVIAVECDVIETVYVSSHTQEKKCRIDVG